MSKKKETKYKFQTYASKEFKDEVKTYAKRMGLTLNAFVLNALKFYKEHNGKNPEQTKILKSKIEQYFIIPFDMTPRTFIAMLYLLSNKYPKASARSFWTHVYYVHDEDMTNKEVIEALNR